MAGSLFQLAQITKGLPWFLPRNNSHLLYNESKDISRATDIWQFSNVHLAMSVSDGTVSFRYKFRDFQGATTVTTESEALVETHC